MRAIRHFLSLKDFTKDEILRIVNISIKIKDNFINGDKIQPYFKNKTLAMIFEKSSTRTRVSFEIGAYQLGGMALFLSNKDIQLGRGESIRDTARVISSMADMIMIRTFEHNKLEEFSSFSRKPVINGLSNEYHPTQLIADYITMLECGIGIIDDACKYQILRKPVVCYIGDGNNMAHSWLMLASKLGFELRVATPKGFEVDSAILELAMQFAKHSGAVIKITNSPKEATLNANVITTDTWISMGQESQKEEKIRQFNGFCVDTDMMNLGDNAIFLHCLPAYRGYEVTDEVIESHSSKVFIEAENRLHAHKGIMTFLEEENWKK